MVSHVHVKVNVHEFKEMTVTDDVRSITVTESIDGLPSGTILLPAKRATRHGWEPYNVYINPGDTCVIEVHTWDGQRGGWQMVLHGPVTSVEERETITPDGYEVATVVHVASMTSILAQDSVALWMFYGAMEGWQFVRTHLIPDRLNSYPHEVAFNWLRELTFPKAVYQHPLPLGFSLHLDFAGLEAVAPLEFKLAHTEGPHLNIIQGILDAPLHELYTLTGTSNDLTGTHQHVAAAPPGINHLGAATLLRCRAAPYPYADENGQGQLDEWEALPLHVLEPPLDAVNQRQSLMTWDAERNFFMVYPAFQFMDELYAFSIGAGLVNRSSVRRFGYRPLQLRTHLIINDTADGDTIEQFMLRLAWRVGTQWNNMHEYANGSVETPLYPEIRVGHRVQMRTPWQSRTTLEYHVRGRQLTWNPREGGRMTLNLERGLPVEMYQDPTWFTRGLTAVRVGGEVYAEGIKRHR